MKPANDIVYFVKFAPHNEELRYSLRTVVKNFRPFNQIVFYGSSPLELFPDWMVNLEQKQPTKWQNVRWMMEKACQDDNLTEDFWLFNDDFFVMNRVDTTKQPQLYEGALQERIEQVEKRWGRRTQYTERLRHLLKTLQDAGIENPLNYAVHKPMLINRKKMAKILAEHPDEPMIRALYGNLANVGGVDEPDIKVAGQFLRPDVIGKTFISTDDYAFEMAEVGTYIKERFTAPSPTRTRNGLPR